MVTALGTHSPKLDAVRALRTKRGRREQGRFSVEGPTLLTEAVRSGRQPEAVFATEAAYQGLDPTVAAALTCPVYLVEERAVRRLSDLETTPGLVAVLPVAIEPAERLLDGEPVLLLAGIGDPGNAGTLLRSAEAFGIDRTFFAEGGVEPYNPKVVRGSMGSIFRQRLATVDAARLPAIARAAGYTLVAADRDGVPLGTFVFPERTIVAIGSERGGVGKALETWDVAVAIPQLGAAESLNAAVAGSIILFAFAQQRSDLSRALSTRQKP